MAKRETKRKNPPGKKPGLTEKQKLFCNEYIKDFNATRAAKAAGYSDKTAYSIGEENLRKPELDAYIRQLSESRNKQLNIDIHYVIQKLKKVVENDLTETQEKGREGCTWEYIRSLPADTRQLINDITPVINQKTGEVFYKFKMMDKNKAAELLGKHLSAFTDNVNLSGSVEVNTFNDLVKSHAEKKKKE